VAGGAGRTVAVGGAAGRTVEGLPWIGVADCACADAEARITAPAIKPSDFCIRVSSLCSVNVDLVRRLLQATAREKPSRIRQPKTFPAHGKITRNAGFSTPREDGKRKFRARVLGVRAPWGAIERAMMSDASKYKQYALDCERIAQTMTEEHRNSLLKIAEAWRDLAREAERKSQPGITR
jgi:hypothetical protein